MKEETNTVAIPIDLNNEIENNVKKLIRGYLDNNPNIKIEDIEPSEVYFWGRLHCNNILQVPSEIKGFMNKINFITKSIGEGTQTIKKAKLENKKLNIPQSVKPTRELFLDKANNENDFSVFNIFSVPPDLGIKTNVEDTASNKTVKDDSFPKMEMEETLSLHGVIKKNYLENVSKNIKKSIDEAIIIGFIKMFTQNLDIYAINIISEIAYSNDSSTAYIIKKEDFHSLPKCVKEEIELRIGKTFTSK